MHAIFETSMCAIDHYNAIWSVQLANPAAFGCFSAPVIEMDTCVHQFNKISLQTLANCSDYQYQVALRSKADMEI